MGFFAFISQAPNGSGALLSLAQLILYATYYKSTQRQIAARKAEGEVGLSEVVVNGDSKKGGSAPDQNGHESEINMA